MTTICSTWRKHFLGLFSFVTYHRVCNQINTTGVASGVVTAYPSGASEFTPGFQCGSCYSIFNFICMFCAYVFLRYTESNYPFGIFKIFQKLTMYLMNIKLVHLLKKTFCSSKIIVFARKIEYQYGCFESFPFRQFCFVRHIS